MKKNKRKKNAKKSLNCCEPEVSNLHESETFFTIHIRYSYTVSELAFLYLKLYQLANRRYYQNVMKSIFSRREKRSRKGKVEAVFTKVEKELEKLENQEKKEREKKVLILAECFVRCLQQFVLVSQECCFKDLKVSIGIHTIHLDKRL